MKVVINTCWGGFSLSEVARKELGLNHSHSYIERNDPRLIEIIERLGSEACSGQHAKLKIVEIPNGIEWEIDEYDGMESVAEKHCTWG